jgi:hypothetical protein
MKTQKELLADVQNRAFNANCTVTVRKNSYGEYELRVRLDGKPRNHYFADSFSDACDTANLILAGVEKEQAKVEAKAQAEYDRELQTALDTVNLMLSYVGCLAEIDAQGTVTMYSPRTGRHSLNMRRGTRPVSDLLVHAMGFAEQQTHAPRGEYTDPIVQRESEQLRG